MPKKDKYDDDDYVAKLLAEDAKKSSAKYASVGLSALLPRRPTGSAPKPNTRFLKNLVRDADVHNAALKKKEELEARIRLREIQKTESERREEHHRERKRRRLNKELDEQFHDEPDMKDKKKRKKRQRESKDKNRSDQRHHHGREKDDTRYEKSIVSTEQDEPTIKRHKSKDDQSSRHSYADSAKRNRHRDHESSNPHPAHRHARKVDEPHSLTGREKGTKSLSRKHSRRKSTSSEASSSSSSDPLEVLVGPSRTESEAVHIRGRGANRSPKSISNIDAHFSSNYDPTLDIEPHSDQGEADRDDWDLALEAHRDRKMWKQKQADRMREAGWNDKEIKKWKKSATARLASKEKDLASVKWNRKGEEREWDRGKDLEEEESD